jgi:myo-inositol catabolism protein IolS
MLTKSFGKLGWPVSAVGLGAWNIGNQWGEIDDATAWQTVRAAYDAGMTLFDVAESYGLPNGLSETRVGQALSGVRHNVIVVSKIGNWGQRSGCGIPKTGVDSIRISGHAILGRLRTDWVDVILCHKGDLADPTIYLEGFEALKDEGCLRAYGISTNSLEVLKRFNREGTCSVVQVDYSLLNRDPEEGFLPYCKEHGIAVMVRGPLAKGLLSGRYRKGAVFTDSVRAGWNAGGGQQAQFEAGAARVGRLSEVVSPGEEMVQAAIRYTFSHDAVSVAIPGAKSATQARANAAAGSRMLTAEELTRLQEAIDG